MLGSPPLGIPSGGGAMALTVITALFVWASVKVAVFPAVPIKEVWVKVRNGHFYALF